MAADLDADVIIIGSGAGGATLALQRHDEDPAHSPCVRCPTCERFKTGAQA